MSPSNVVGYSGEVALTDPIGEQPANGGPAAQKRPKALGFRPSTLNGSLSAIELVVASLGNAVTSATTVTLLSAASLATATANVGAYRRLEQPVGSSGSAAVSVVPSPQESAATVTFAGVDGQPVGLDVERLIAEHKRAALDFA